MPDRIIRDEILESSRWLSLKDNSDRLAFIAILLHADSLGNFPAEQYRLLRMWRDFGIQSLDLVAKTLSELVDHDLIRLYEVGEETFLHVPRFGQSMRYIRDIYPLSPWTTNEEKQRLTNKSHGDHTVTTTCAPQKERKKEVVNPSPRKRVDAQPNGSIEVRRNTWQAYSDAYEFRYGVPPIRDAKANSAIKAFCNSVPATESAAVAQFFLQNSNSFYVSKGHPPTLLALDAAKLRTEWATGRHTTQTEAMQADKTAARKNVFQPLIDEAKQRENSKS